MRKLLLLSCALSCSLLYAQNWALINPDYKYNYSNDGTDTISNQVFVTHVDTLGVDSFRYELNRIALVCDTCGSGDYSVFIRLDEPQFLGGQVTRSQGIWHLQNGVSYVLIPEAADGTTWLMDTVNGVWAAMGQTLVGTPFDPLEERRAIQLSTGDSIVIGRNHGILRWPSGYQLIGINGPDVGRTTPAFADFFPYATGDVIQYATEYGWCNGLGECNGKSLDYKFTFGTEGIAQDSAMIYSGLMLEHTIEYSHSAGMWTPMSYVHSYANYATTWHAGVPELPWPELLFSYPGQLVRTTHRVFPDAPWEPVWCVGEHGIDGNGRYTIGCRNLGGGHFLFGQNPLPTQDGYIEFYGPEDYCNGGPEPDCGVRYSAGLGLERFIGNYFERGESYILSGAVLGGDTIGTITPDDILLGVKDQDMADQRIFPNPASDHLQLSSVPPGTVCSILNTTGQVLLKHTTSSSAERIDVSILTPGLYILKIAGIGPFRFVIAR